MRPTSANEGLQSICWCQTVWHRMTVFCECSTPRCCVRTHQHVGWLPTGSVFCHAALLHTGQPQKQHTNPLKWCCTGRTLHELTFTDAPELKDCYLLGLAAAPSFTLFRCVLLAASPQVIVMLSSLTCLQLHCKLPCPPWESAGDMQS